MSELSFKYCGATVHRVWGTLPDAELLAAFTSMHHAEVFCRAALGQEPKEAFLLVVYSTGETRCFHRSKPALGEQP